MPEASMVGFGRFKPAKSILSALLSKLNFSLCNSRFIEFSKIKLRLE